MVEHFKLDPYKEDNTAPMAGFIEVGYKFHDQPVTSPQDQKGDKSGSQDYVVAKISKGNVQPVGTLSSPKPVINKDQATQSKLQNAMLTGLEHYAGLGVQFALMAMARRPFRGVFSRIFSRSDADDIPPHNPAFGNGFNRPQGSVSDAEWHDVPKDTPFIGVKTAPAQHVSPRLPFWKKIFIGGPRRENFWTGLILLQRGGLGIDSDSITYRRIFKDHLGPALLPKRWQRWEMTPPEPEPKVEAVQPQKKTASSQDGSTQPSQEEATPQQEESVASQPQAEPQATPAILQWGNTLRISSNAIHPEPTPEQVARRDRTPIPPEPEDPIHRPRSGRPIIVHPTGPEQVAKPPEEPHLRVRTAREQRIDQERAALQRAAEEASVRQRTVEQQPLQQDPLPEATDEQIAKQTANTDQLNRLKEVGIGGLAISDVTPPRSFNIKRYAPVELHPAAGQGQTSYIRNNNGSWSRQYLTIDGSEVTETVLTKGLFLEGRQDPLPNDIRILVRQDGFTRGYERLPGKKGGRYREIPELREESGAH